MKSVIYLLVICFTSTRGRVATNSDPLITDINNMINEIVKITTVNDSKVHQDLPIVQQDPVLEILNNSIVVNDDTDDLHSNITINKYETDNSIDSDETEPCSDSLPEDTTYPALILSTFIKENRFEEARNASRVTDEELFLGFKSYSGFFTVDEIYNSNLFFWYFPVEDKPLNETPWIIWLQGGPGASSMTGLFDEIGPFHVLSNGTLIRNPYSWLKDHSLVFIDNPVGTGFSFTDSRHGFTTDMNMYGNHLYSTLCQFLKVFPELRTAPLFIAGESYAGKYIPALATLIHNNSANEEINLQGLIAGNAYVDPAMISQMQRPFYYFGLLETEQIELIRPLLDAFQDDITAKRSVAAKGKWNHLIKALLLITHQNHAYNFLSDDLPVGNYLSFLHKPRVKNALHVGEIRFSFVNMTVNVKLDGDFLSSAKEMYEELLSNYRVLTYCGQLDQMLSCVMTSENYRTWKWNGSQEFLDAIRHPYLYNGRLAGYHKSGGHLTEVVVRGAGHMAPMDAPGPMQALITRWTHHLDLGHYSILDSPFIQEYVQNNSMLIYL